MSTMTEHGDFVTDFELGHCGANPVDDTGSIESKFLVGDLAHCDHDFTEAGRPVSNFNYCIVCMYLLECCSLDLYLNVIGLKFSLGQIVGFHTN